MAIETVNEASTYQDDDLSLVRLRKQFTDFSTVKLAEIDEARQSWRYYHGVQWTKEEIAALKARRQPVITFNRVLRKINGLVGVVQKLRNDPKAFPRTAAHDAGAELATAVLRYVLDASRWVDVETDAVLAAAVHGLGVCELSLEPGDHQDPDIRVDYVDPVTYFYDPRSVRADFSDIRYDGVARWASEDEIAELFPDVDLSTISESASAAETTQYDYDREFLWINERKKIRLVEHWYKHRGQWKWCIYANWTILARGVSPFVDERGMTMSRYIKFAHAVDQDGDRYGFVRSMKGPQDAINQHRSKAMHIMNTRQVWARRGVFQDIEHARKEAARPDGFLEYDGTPEDVRIEQPAQEFIQQTQYFQDAKEEIENYGPSPAIVGTNVNQRSGRALAMMQQSGIAEMGTFLKNYRSWKLRLYRAIWTACRMHWQAERFIRVLDDQETAQFIQVNAVQVGAHGLPQIVNHLGALDVEIILDEGPDSTNVMGDVFDILASLAQSKIPVPPQVFVEMAPLPKSVKQKIIGMITAPPDPMKQQAAQLELAEAQAKVADTQAAAGLKQAQAVKTMKEAGSSEAPQDPLDRLMTLHETAARVSDMQASARKKHAEADRTEAEAAFAPIVAAHDMRRDIEDAAHGMAMDHADLSLRADAQRHAQENPPRPAADR